MSEYYNFFHVGNKTLYKNILISSVSSFQNCPIKLDNNCPVLNRGFSCYAAYSERIWEKTRIYRENQFFYWKKHSIKTIYEDIKAIIQLRKNILPIKYFRINETGDFYNQKIVNKISSIAQRLKDNFDIITYGYTANKELNYDNIHFILRGSFFKCNNGLSMVIKKNEIEEYRKIGFLICPKIYNEICGLNCKICMKKQYINIAMVYHSGGTKKLKREIKKCMTKNY